MKIYLLDTNVISHILRGDSPCIDDHVGAIPNHAIFVSAVSEAEILYGLFKCGNPERLAVMIEFFFSGVTVLPWHRNAAHAYAELRNRLRADGKRLEPFDMMIAAHAKAAGAILVSRDKSFNFISTELCVESWAD